MIRERVAAQGRQSQSGDRGEDRVIGGDSGDANGSKTVWCTQWRGGAHGGDPQSGCGDDGAGAGAEKPVMPDP
jgi:hypothetical protein